MLQTSRKVLGMTGELEDLGPGNRKKAMESHFQEFCAFSIDKMDGDDFSGEEIGV